MSKTARKIIFKLYFHYSKIVKNTNNKNIDLKTKMYHMVLKIILHCIYLRLFLLILRI